MKEDMQPTLTEDQIVVERTDGLSSSFEFAAADPDDDGTSENTNQTNDKS